MIPNDDDVICEPRRVLRTVLVVDLVESVRLIEGDEEGTIRRWQELVEHVVTHVLPRVGGRLVKSLGDGLMLEFEQVRPAISAAFEINAALEAGNKDAPSDRVMRVRVGAHVGRVITGRGDIFGHDVNLAARLATLGQPGEIVVSAGVRDELTDLLDADIEDLGDCHLKHVAQPIRAYRVGPPAPNAAPESRDSGSLHLRPAIAVIPFTARAADPEHGVLGEVLADDVIAALSSTSHLYVISRLSTMAFRDRQATLAEIGRHLQVHYVLSGTYRVSGDRLTAVAELAEVGSQRIVWTARLQGDVRGVVSGQDELVTEIVTHVSEAVLDHELQRAKAKPLPNLQSYTLLMGAIVLMHRGSHDDFERAGKMLEALTERARRAAVPHAWMAKWHVLRFNRGWSRDQAAEARLALDCTRRALDADDRCALALTIDGFVHTNLLKRLDIGEERYGRALEANPNESLAWLLKGTLHAFRGEGAAAVEGTRHALLLSPLDPLRYFYESLAATAAHSAGDYERAIELAKRSLKSNRVHPSTLRALAIAQSQLGLMDEARETVIELLEVEPGLTVASYLEHNPSGAFETGRIWSEALRRAGLPL